MAERSKTRRAPDYGQEGEGSWDEVAVAVNVSLAVIARSPVAAAKYAFTAAVFSSYKRAQCKPQLLGPTLVAASRFFAPRTMRGSFVAAKKEEKKKKYIK